MAGGGVVYKGVRTLDPRFQFLAAQARRQPPLEGLPTLAETMKDAASIAAPVEAIEGIIREDEENRLY